MINNMTMDEIQRKHDEEVLREETEKAESEARKMAELESCSNMSMGEYIAHRNGKEYIPPEDYENLSMEEYIKARKR